MRIIGGRHRGRSLRSPAGATTRPLADRARESLFNILAHGLHKADGQSRLADAVVLDAFAGTGALGLEALSRGATSAVFFEIAPEAQIALRANIAALKEGHRSRVVAGDCRYAPRADRACDLVFLSPPYHKGLAEPAWASLRTAGWVAQDALIVVELDRKEPLIAPQGTILLDERKYGRVRFLFFRDLAPLQGTQSP